MQETVSLEPIKKKREKFGYTQAMQIIYVLIGSVIIFPGIGYYLDTKLGWTPILTIIGMAYGVVSAFVYIWQKTKE